MSDDYLWDKSGDVDPDVAELERALAPMKYAPRPLALAPVVRKPRNLALSRASLALAAAITIGIGVRQMTRAPAISLAVSALEGQPRIESHGFAKNGRLGLGGWLETDATSRAEIELATIGHVEVAPDSRVRLIATGPNEQHLELARGRIDAKVLAPPRLFVVDTPSARATDLGCAYRLEVVPGGGSILSVSSGAVELAGAGRDAWVPANAACETRPGKGPGCPYFTDASDAFKAALRRFDFEDDGDALVAVLAEARARDTLTMWYLHHRTGGDPRVLDRIRAFAPWSSGAPSLRDLSATW